MSVSYWFLYIRIILITLLEKYNIWWGALWVNAQPPLKLCLTSYNALKCVFTLNPNCLLGAMWAYEYQRVQNALARVVVPNRPPGSSSLHLLKWLQRLPVEWHIKFKIATSGTLLKHNYVTLMQWANYEVKVTQSQSFMGKLYVSERPKVKILRWNNGLWSTPRTIKFYLSISLAELYQFKQCGSANYESPCRVYVCVCAWQTAGMETDDLQAQLSHLQQLIVDEEQKQRRQKVPLTLTLTLIHST